MSSLNLSKMEDEIKSKFNIIITKLKDDTLSIDDRMKLITKEICELETNEEETFLMNIFLEDNSEDIEFCFYLKTINLTYKLDHQDNKGNTAIMYAFKTCKNKFILLELLEQKPNLDIISYDQYSTPTMMAFRCCNDEDVLLKLLEYKPNLNINNDNYANHSAIHTAFSRNHTDKVLIELLRSNIDLNMRDLFYNTITMKIFRNCTSENVLLELLKLEPNLDLHNAFGKTATSFAFMNVVSNKVLSKLLEQKPRFDIADEDNKSPFDYAIECYVLNNNFDFTILEKLYDNCLEQNKDFVSLDYIRIRRRYKLVPIILFRKEFRDNFLKYQ